MTETPKRRLGWQPAAITIEIDPAEIGQYSDQRLALAWHVAQANPARHGDHAAGELAERIGWEIIRRWLGGVPPEMYAHQGNAYYWDQLRRFATYRPGDPEFHDGEWVAKETPDA